MPILVEKCPFDDRAPTFPRSARDKLLKNLYKDQPKYLDIGLINNMPDAAMEATARQFLTLLGTAAHSIVLRLKLFSMPGIPCSQWRRQHISTYYSDFHGLWDSHLDGVIVTGTEPRCRPYG